MFLLNNQPTQLNIENAIRRSPSISLYIAKVVLIYLVRELSTFSHISHDWHSMSLRDGAQRDRVLFRGGANDHANFCPLGGVLQ